MTPPRAGGYIATFEGFTSIAFSRWMSSEVFFRAEPSFASRSRFTPANASPTVAVCEAAITSSIRSRGSGRVGG